MRTRSAAVGDEVALTTPSAVQSGLKMNVSIDVAANQLADFVLDFDACKSFVKLGGSDRYLLKPVIRVVPRVTTGMRVVGYVSPALAAATTTVSVQANGVLVKSTRPTHRIQRTLSMSAPRPRRQRQGRRPYDHGVPSPKPRSLPST